jgi:uncharacterized protein YndB with AHSA1/START domain
MQKFLKVVLWVAIALVAVLNVCIILGMRAPREHVVSRSVVLNQQPAKVWQVLTDYASQPQWRPDVKSVKRLPDMNGMEVWREDYKMGGGETLVTEQWVPPSYLVRTIADENGPVQGSWEFRIESAGAGVSRVTIVEHGSVSNPLWRFVSAYVYRYRYIDDFLKQLGAKFGEKVAVT